MLQQTVPLILELPEETSSEPPGTLRAEQAPSYTPTQKSIETKNPSQWCDWRWQMRNRIRTIQQLARYLPSCASCTDLPAVIAKYPMAVTPYYASLIRDADLSDPVLRMSIPNPLEMADPPCLSEDPLEEHDDMPVPGLVHRYPDRALLIATTTCSTYCRHCTRKRIAGTRETSISPARLRQVVEYLNAHPEISDVIVSGGDPLTMADASIETTLAALRSVPSVQIIRIGTRVPVVLPMRITDELVAMLRKYQPLWLNTHFNHPSELTTDAADACARLADAGIPLGNQTVLLKGVNDDCRIIEKLCRGLVRMRVRPYYLYQCDLVRGVEHFRTSVRKGIEIMEYLRGRLSGIAIPTFVVDAPHGGGKIPIMPTYVISMSPTHTVLRNYEGLLVNYPEPGMHTTEDQSQDGTSAGVWELAAGKISIIQPAHTNRGRRREKITNTNKSPAKKGSYLFDM